MMKPATSMHRALVLLLPFALLGACGQRGDLFIPDPEREVIATVPTGQAAAPATDAADDEEERDVQ